MIYYLRNKRILEEFQNKADRELLIYPEKENIQNYAFTILYEKEHFIEQVIRTGDLKNHYLAMKLLYKKSEYLKHYVTYKEASQEIQDSCISSLTKNGNTVIYNMTSNKSNEIGGLLYLSKNPSDWAKEYLKSHMNYLMLFKDMAIYQDDASVGMKVWCEFGQNIFKDCLEKILK